MTTPTQNPAPGTAHKPTAVPNPPAPAANTAAPASTTASATNGEDQAEDKKEKKTKSKTGVSRPRLPKFDESHLITVLRPNAKIRASGERYNQYKTGMTVKQYIDIMQAEPFKRTVGQIYGDLRWDTDPNRKLINIGPTVVPVPPPPEPKAKATKAAKEAKEEPAKPAA